MESSEELKKAELKFNKKQQEFRSCDSGDFGDFGDHGGNDLPSSEDLKRLEEMPVVSTKKVILKSSELEFKEDFYYTENDELSRISDL